MQELPDFYNDGFGWVCKACQREIEASGKPELNPLSTFREGEAETKTPDLSGRALAKWTDATRRFLMCPRCGITAPAELS